MLPNRMGAWRLPAGQRQGSAGALARRCFVTATLAGIMTMAGCADGLVDLNVNPNQPERIDDPALLMTRVTKSAGDLLANQSFETGNLAGQYAAKQRFTAFELLQWEGNGGAWNGLYTLIRDAEIVSELGHAGYGAVADILKGWAGLMLTDLYGDVPFSQAAQARIDGNFTPSYDRQEDIYEAIHALLAGANDRIAAGVSPVRGDIINNSDFDRWRRLANALRLRMYLRTSEVDPAGSRAGVQALLADPDRYPLPRNAGEATRLQYLSGPPNSHPWSGSGRQIAFEVLRVSTPLFDVLSEADDPRLAHWFVPVGDPAAIQPLAPGLNDGNSRDIISSTFNPAVFFQTTRPVFFLPYHEVAFLLAEASHRGWIEGSPEARYREALAAAFAFTGLTMPEDFPDRPSVAYNGSLERILTQKWVSFVDFEFQGWHDWVRTGFPSFIAPGPDAVLSAYPRRFEYPSSEQALNAGSWNEAVSRLGGDDSLLGRKWWDAR
jgi:hypothetical protein